MQMGPWRDRESLTGAPTFPLVPHTPWWLQMGPLRDREPLVHWCHGATGAVFLLCRAHEVLGAARYLEAALRSGEAVWERGLLRKGPGACHGVR